MSAKRFSVRQSWDAVKYASELCQRSFEGGFVHLSPFSGYQSVQRPHPAYARRSSIQDEQSLVDRSSNESYGIPSLYSVDGVLSQPSSIYSTEKLEFPQNSSLPEHDRPSISNGRTALDIESSDEKTLVFRTATKDDLETFVAAHPLPPPHGHQITREFRYKWFSAYRKLWASAVVPNIAILAIMITLTLRDPTMFSYNGSSTATGANLMVAALMRQEHVINTLFRISCLLPNNAPLSLRRRAAKVYSYGGIHSGCAVSAFLWYVFTVALIFTRLHGSEVDFKILAVLTVVTLLVLVLIILLSHPTIRRAKHDLWEASHRFGGWTAVVLVWAQAIVLVVARAHDAQLPIRKVLFKTPTFWFLVIITACLIYPWLRLRKRNVQAEVLSSHAIRLYFEDGTLPTCAGYKLSRKPLIENHGFATISNTADEEVGYSIIVSNNGDFTKEMITNPPTHIYTRGAPVTGVMRIATLFQRIVIVTTGSGIGPALSFMNVRPDWPMRVIWVARDPESTYGAEIINAVLRADRRAIIVDTKKIGYPDMPALTFAAYESFGAEAVMLVSNPAVTANVVFEMESRGVPAFGPIFDS